jgi:hypothetical protein
MASDDLVIPPLPGVEGWSENLFFFPYDSKQGVAISSHVGRSSQDPNLWREFLQILLPGGRNVVFKGFGRRHDESESKIGGAHLQYDCIEPFTKWRFRFDGIARDTTMAQLFEGASTDGESVRVRFELDVEPIHPAWSANTTEQRAQHGAGGAFAGDHPKFHYEQICIYRGPVVVGDESFELDARGFRDHTRGVRKFQARSGHTLLSCSFPSGLGGGFYQVRAPDGEPIFSQGYTLDAGKPYDAEVLSAPTLRAIGLPGPFEVRMRAHDGSEIVVEGTPQLAVPMTFFSPNELVHGIDGIAGHYACVMSPSILRCAGEEGVGHLELSGIQPV